MLEGIYQDGRRYDARSRKAAEASLSLHLVAGDMRAFHLQQHFRSVLIAGNSLCHLLTNRDPESCLECIHEHLQPEGTLLLDLFVPDIHLLSRDSQTRYPFARFLDPADGRETVIEQTRVHDSATQVNHIATIARRPSGAEEVGQLPLRMYFPQELDALLTCNEFAIEEKLGSCRDDPFGSNSQKQLVIATLAVEGD